MDPCLDPEGLGDEKRAVDELVGRRNHLDVEEPGCVPREGEGSLQPRNPAADDDDSEEVAIRAPGAGGCAHEATVENDRRRRRAPASLDPRCLRSWKEGARPVPRRGRGPPVSCWSSTYPGRELRTPSASARGRFEAPSTRWRPSPSWRAAVSSDSSPPSGCSAPGRAPRSGRSWTRASRPSTLERGSSPPWTGWAPGRREASRSPTTTARSSGWFLRRESSRSS